MTDASPAGDRAKPDLTVHITDKQLSSLAAGINLSEIRRSIPALEALCNAKIQATEEFNDLCKLVSLKSKVNAQVISSYITAVCNDTLSKKEQQTEQLSLLFSELS